MWQRGGVSSRGVQRSVQIPGMRVQLAGCSSCEDRTTAEVMSTAQRDGCPKIINLGSAKTDLFYERKKYGFKKR